MNILLWSVLVWSADAQATDLNSILCDAKGWEYNSRYVSVSQQTKHVRGDGPGLLFEYTRDRKDLFDSKGEFRNNAYRPTATKALSGLDLSGHKRVSFWLYVEGNAEEAFQWGFGSNRPFRLSCRRGRWFHAQWYLDEAGADLKDPKPIIFAGVNQGTAPGDPTRARIYLSDFRLEKDEDEVHVGWDPDPSQIVFAYSGVYPGESVMALVAAEHAGKSYRLEGSDLQQSGRVSSVKQIKGKEFAEIRVVSSKQAGDYRLSVADGPATTLRVREDPYDEAAGKALRAMRAQRCGCASELHGPCHLDDAVRSDTGQSVDVSGGWHDEGVSQYTHLTVRTTGCLARFRRSRGREYRLGLNEDRGDDLLAEIEWGVKSILKYELEPAVHYHSLVVPYWYHTDNQPGTGDERKIVVFHPHQLSCWWRTEALALAASVCREPLRSQAKALAERYWRMHEQVDQLYTLTERTKWKNDANNLRVTAARIGASIEMFRLTGERRYADDAVQTASHLLTFQQREPSGRYGLVGYFYKNLGSPAPYNGVNCKSQDVPGRTLAELLMALPNHPQASQWREALVMYAEGTLKPLARLNAPYGCVASGPYHKPLTSLFLGEKRGEMLVYPVHFYCQTRRSREFLRHAAAKSQLNVAAQLAAMGQALKDEELVDMAHSALRYLFGANPSHVSMMRHLGERFPVNAQLPDVPGMMVGWMGLTSDGLPFFDPHGAGRLDGPDRFMVKEGNTATSAFLLDACSYLE